MNDETRTVTSTDNGKPHEIIKGLTSIIIPVYLTDYSLFHYTGHCIGSVREHTNADKTPYEIIVVDNGSPLRHPDPSMYKADKYVRNEKNLGVTEAWNQGIRVSQGEYICLLNNDTMVFDYWLEDMQKSLTKLDLVMATPMYGDPFARAKESEIKRKAWVDKEIDEAFSDFRDFACVLTKRELFEELGIFDEQFLTYAQDSDFLKRMDEAGKKYASNKAVSIFHIINATGGTMKENPEVMNEDKEKFRLKWEKSSDPGTPGVSTSDVSGFEDLAPAPHPDPSPAVEEIHDVPEEARVMRVFRTPVTADKVYWINEEHQTYHWVTSPVILDKLGFGFDDVIETDKSIFDDMMQGDPITASNIDEYTT